LYKESYYHFLQVTSSDQRYLEDRREIAQNLNKLARFLARTMAIFGQSILGKTALVTGSSSGNGRAIALALAKAGANIVCADLVPAARAGGYEQDNHPTHVLVEMQYGRKTVFQKCDVSQPGEIKDAIARAVQEFGRLDIMINNAGIFTGLKTIVETTEEDYDKTMTVNSKGTYFGCKYAIEQFLVQEPFQSPAGGPKSLSIGKIVNLASMGGLIGLREEPAYCASKGAVVNLTRQLAVDFGKKGVNINVVCPGFMETALARPFLDEPQMRSFLEAATPWPGFGSAEDVANATLWLSAPEGDFMNGSVLTIDGGYTAR
jgi:NAD(P)-dependent dehydrogenase (short-subunit alcohol dehydrogenase family)